MSYPYHVRVSKTVEQTVNAKDRVTHRLKVDPILSAEDLARILQGVLTRRGFREHEGAMVRDRADGCHERVDLATLEVTVSLERSDKVTKEKTLQVTGDAHSKEDKSAMEERLRLQVEAQLEKSLAITDEELRAKEREVQKKIVEILAASAEERRRELLEVVAEVQADALKTKARSLGTIMSIEERRSADGSEFELVIKITE